MAQNSDLGVSITGGNPVPGDNVVTTEFPASIEDAIKKGMKVKEIVKTFHCSYSTISKLRLKQLTKTKESEIIASIGGKDISLRDLKNFSLYMFFNHNVIFMDYFEREKNGKNRISR